MKIVSNYGVYNPQYKSVTEIKRSQPAPQPLSQPVAVPKEEKPNYNWKAIAIIAGVSALALLGIGNRKNIAKIIKNLTKDNAKEPFHNPNMKVSVNNVNPENSEYFPESWIRESFEPERLSDLMLKKDRINQKRYKRVTFIDQDGKTIRKKTPLYDEEDMARKKDRFNFQNRDFATEAKRRSAKYRADEIIQDAADTAVNFAIFDDLLNGGKEIKNTYNFVKNAFSKGNAEDIMDKGMSSIDEAVGSGGSAIGDFFTNFGERTTDFVDDVFKTASDFTEGLGDGLGEIVDSLGDVV